MKPHYPDDRDSPHHAAGTSRGTAVAWAVNLLLGMGLVALVVGGVVLRTETERVVSPERTEVLEARTLAAKAETARLERSMDAVFHGLMEARGLSSRARSLVGLDRGVIAYGQDVHPALPPSMAAGDPATIMPASYSPVADNLREARRLKYSFREIVAGMQAEADVWARIPSVPPLEAPRLTSDFGLRRDPFTRRLTWHRGLDLAAPRGTPVHATAEGVVIRAGRYGGYGLLVELDHENGIRTRYAHNSRLAVRPGDRVRRGTVISYVGSTGRANAAHLHYEVMLNGEAVNPEPYLMPETFFAD